MAKTKTPEPIDFLYSCLISQLVYDLTMVGAIAYYSVRVEISDLI